MAIRVSCPNGGDHLVGEAADFIVEVQVWKNGVMIDRITHTLVEPDGSGPWWAFDFLVKVEPGDELHVVDISAGNVYEGEPGTVIPLPAGACVNVKVEESTTTTAAPVATSTAAVTTVPAVDITPAQLIVDSTVVVGSSSIPVVTTAVVQTTQPGNTDPTLPRTGAGTTPLIGTGLGFLVVGAAAVFIARRRRPTRVA